MNEIKTVYASPALSGDNGPQASELDNTAHRFRGALDSTEGLMKLPPRRRGLAAVVFADMVGYSRLMQTNEHLAIRNRNTFRRAVKRVAVSHGGEVIQFYGDGALLVFGSAAGAAGGALAMQAMLQANEILTRVGVHLGDVVRDEDGVYGDGVNVAARAEAACPVGSVLITGPVAAQLGNQAQFRTRALGVFGLKNIVEPVELFALVDPRLNVPTTEQVAARIPARPRVHRSSSAEGSGILRILGELGRRHVYKVAGGYTIAAVGLITLVEYAVALMGLPQTVLTAVVLAAVAGFPACMILAWVFDIAPEGVVRTGPLDDTAASLL